jgi:1-deoxy-D-xylulose-5-phosphate reductoisomerase
MSAIVGAAGLAQKKAASQAGKRVLLANKESLVMSGELLMQAVQKSGAVLLPIDSEHNAIFQCLPPAQNKKGIAKIILTASGGPFRTRSLDSLADVTVEQAVAHPNWLMGQKISIDSATMMNKGLEVIEAHYLFDTPADKIEVLIHPQSIVHSMVSYTDGSVLAQMGNPDMRTPIAYGLAWPDRMESGVAALDLTQHKLEFYKPDLQRFKALELAYQALHAGGIMPCVLNAANEIAVAAFLNHELGFLKIAETIERVLSSSAWATQQIAQPNLEQVLSTDAQARQLARKIITNS